MGSDPVQTWIFFQALLSLLLKQCTLQRGSLSFMSLQCKLVTVWLVLFHLTLWRRTSARNISLINSRVRRLRLCHDTIYQIVSPLYTLLATTTLPLLFRLKILWSLHKTFHAPSSGGGEGEVDWEWSLRRRGYNNCMIEKV